MTRIIKRLRKQIEHLRITRDNATGDAKAHLTNIHRALKEVHKDLRKHNEIHKRLDNLIYNK